MAEFNVQVNDQNGNPVSGTLIEVNTYLSSDWGKPGITLNPNPRLTGANGLVNFYSGPALAAPIMVQGTLIDGRYAPVTAVASSPFNGSADMTLTIEAQQLFKQAPTRDQVCKVAIPFQGFTFQSQEFGAIPMFGPETSTLNDVDLSAYFAYIKSIGFTHCEFAISWQYDETTYQYPVPGRDLSNNLPELNRRIRIAVQNGLYVGLFLAGDGLSAPPNPDGSYPYNDPQGWTYGFQWLMANLARIIAGLQTDNVDLTKWMFFSPGYDGVFYGWSPAQVTAFSQLFRSILPNGYLAIEFNTGHIPVGNGPADYAANGAMVDYDIILGEFDNWPTTGDPTWQIAARLLGPLYKRPSDQPSGDDPHPPNYLIYPSSRGPYYPIPYEYATYPWVRSELTAAQVAAGRTYYSNLGYPTVC